MNVLILSCATGGGHRAAAEAIAGELARRGVPHMHLDALEAFGRGALARRANTLYVDIVRRAPVAFQAMYWAGGLISSSRYKSPVYAFSRCMADGMGDCIEQGGFDTVVVTHLFPAQTLTNLRACGRIVGVHTVAVATDYTCTPFWEETCCDRYVIPHPELAKEYAARGVPEAKLVPLGIPVRAGFADHVCREEARRQLGLPQDGPVVLVMAGSMGFGSVEELVAQLCRTCTGRERIAVVCGTNQALFERLQSRFAGDGRVFLYGFERRIPLFMDASDVLLTKPGGLTCTEAAVKGIPLIHTRPIPGCETKNAAFFARHGMSMPPCAPALQAVEACRLCRPGPEAACMVAAQHSTINRRAAEDLCDLLERGEEAMRA